MSVKNEDNNPSLILKENSLPCVEYFCSGQSHVPSKQYYEAGSASYACPIAAQGKFWVFPLQLLRYSYYDT